MLEGHRTLDLVELFLSDCRYRNLSPKAIADYAWFLRDIQARLGDLMEIDRHRMKQMVSERLGSGISPATANHYIRTIKVFYSFLCREEIIPDNPMQKLKRVSEPHILKPVLCPNDISKLLSMIPDRGYYRLRNRAMLMILWDAALRVNECLSIRLFDVDMTHRTIKVFGKGRKERVVPFGLKTRRELQKYLMARRNIGSDWLFCTRDGLRMMPRNFQRWLADLGKKIGLKVSPHLIRHSSATYLAKEGIPGQHLQILLGHSSLAITQTYINQIMAQEGLQVSHRRLSPGDNL